MGSGGAIPLGLVCGGPAGRPGAALYIQIVNLSAYRTPNLYVTVESHDVNGPISEPAGAKVSIRGWRTGRAVGSIHVACV